MNFLILSTGGDGIGLGLRLRAEGNNVRLWMKEDGAGDRGKGLLEHAEDVSWGECIVADCTGMGPVLDNLRNHGALVVGGSCLADRLEADRAFAQQVMEQCGIKTPDSQSFTDWDSAAQFIESSEARLVFKPEGSMSGNVPSYCPSDNQELLEALNHFKSLIGENKPEFTLQEFIEGTCISTECFFDGNKFIRPFNHTIERKHLMNGDIGPSGGCTGNVLWLCGDDDPIARETVLKLESFLRLHQYRGTIDVNAVVNEEGVYALEFTPRFGWDSLPTYLYGLYTGEFGRLLYQMARGEGPDDQEVTERFAAGVRLTIPPWPTEKHHAEQGIPIRGIEESDLVTDFYPYDVELQDGKLVTSGGYGIVGVMNSVGASLGEAFSRAYQRVGNVKIPDMQYRTDLIRMCGDEYRQIEYITGKRDSLEWIGVDLDKTLAAGSPKDIGEPVPRMVTRVRRWISSGRDVRILTARAEDVNETVKVYDWQAEHLGTSLEVTDRKDHFMEELYDDRALQVEKNTGEVVG